MSPENIGSNMWLLKENEIIEATDKRQAKGPLGPIKIEGIFEDINRMLVQLPNGDKLEIAGIDFEKAVKTEESK